MCRNIKRLANVNPPAGEDEIRAAAIQFVRKVSSMNRPSRGNELAFNRAVDDVTQAANRLLQSLTTSPPSHIRDEVAPQQARERATQTCSG
jgi:hypothetical protein